MAAYFATSSDYLSPPRLWGTDLARPPVSYMCWVKPDSIAAGERILVSYGVGSASGARCLLAISAANPLFRYNFDLSNASASAGNAQVAGEWSFICGSLSNLGTAHRGRLQQRDYQFTHAADWNQVTAINPWTTGHEFRVAGYSASTVAIAHVAVWKCGLSHREMNALYRGGAHPMDIRPDALLEYWPLAHQSGPLVYEGEVYGTRLVPNGSVTSVEDPSVLFSPRGASSTILVI